MKIFLVDDEIYILEVLKKIIDCESLGLEIIGSATNGVAAFEAIKKQKPDIVITDIKMPGMDGLELVRNVKEMNPKTAFIIISGYDHFQYAQKSIKYGVKDYLLKPISASELNKILGNIIEQYNQSRHRDMQFKSMSSHLEELKAKMNTYFWPDLLSKAKPPFENIADINEEYMLHFQEGSFMIAQCRLDYTDIDQEFLQELFNRIITSIRTHFKPYCHEMIYTIRQPAVIFLFNFSKKTDINRTFEIVLAETVDYLNKFGNIFLTIGIGSLQEEIGRIHISLSDSSEALKSRIFTSLNCICTPPQEMDVPGTLDIIFPETSQKNLARAFQEADKTQIKDLIMQIFALSEKQKISHATYYWQLCSKIDRLFTDTLKDIPNISSMETSPESLDDMLQKCTSVNYIKIALINRIYDRIDVFGSFDSASSNYAVAAAIKYISANYMNRISLNDIAKKVYLNPVYFSILFKRESGVNFVEYVNEYRIQISKEYLKQPKYTISDISSRVGFSNCKYFSKLFKKNVGLTPSEFRNKYISSHKIL